MDGELHVDIHHSCVCVRWGAKTENGDTAERTKFEYLGCLLHEQETNQCSVVKSKSTLCELTPGFVGAQNERLQVLLIRVGVLDDDEQVILIWCNHDLVLLGPHAKECEVVLRHHTQHLTRHMNNGTPTRTPTKQGVQWRQVSAPHSGLLRTAGPYRSTRTAGFKQTHTPAHTHT